MAGVTDRPPEDAIDFALQFVRDAAGMQLDAFGSATRKVKGPLDVVTEADHAIEDAFRVRLREAFPGHGFVGEETTAGGVEDARCSAGSVEGYRWILDPIDGTVNYAYGLGGFCVSLGLLHAGRPVAGWVLDPLRDELFAAIAGGGASLNGARLATLPAAVDAADEAMPVGGSSGLIHRAGGDPALLAAVGKLRILGSQAMHLCHVAAGRMRAALNPEAKLWDDAAGALIVTEAGGRYGGLDGRAVFPLGPDDPAWSGPTDRLARDTLRRVRGLLVRLPRGRRRRAGGGTRRETHAMIAPSRTSARNVFGGPLATCSKDPLTGFTRSGCCETGPEDLGSHTVCAVVTAEFLRFTREAGNDLSAPRPEFRFLGLKPGDRWCLCASRWAEAQAAGVAPPVDLAATHAKALEVVSLETLQSHAAEA